MEQVINIIMGEIDISELDKIKNNSEQFKRWKNVLMIFIKQSRLHLKEGLNKENIKFAVNSFDEMFEKNQILNEYINGSQLDINNVELEITKFYQSILLQLGISSENKIAANVESIFDSGETNQKGKSLVKSNGHSLLENDVKSKGYVGAFLMAALAATIEVTTVAYILMNGM